MFSNGSEYDNWKFRNCSKCKKRYDEDAGEFNCTLEESIDLERVIEGTLSVEEIAQAGNWDGECKLIEKEL